MSRIIIVGAGINGVTAAIELKKRSHEVVLVDPGPLPHPLAASTDISKAVRAAYGADEDYTALAERSIELWRQWNEEFGTELYHEVGVMFVRRAKMEPGDFEYESLKLLEKRGLKVARMDTPQLWKRFPAWNPELYQDGVLEIEAGYAESGRAVAMLIERAKSIGVELRNGSRFVCLDEDGDRVKGIVLEEWHRSAVIAGRFRRDGGGRVDAVSAAVYQEVFPRNRAASVSPQAFRAGVIRTGTFSGFRRRHYNNRLLRISDQSRRRGEDCKSRLWTGRCRRILPSAS